MEIKFVAHGDDKVQPKSKGRAWIRKRGQTEKSNVLGRNLELSTVCSMVGPILQTPEREWSAKRFVKWLRV